MKGTLQTPVFYILFTYEELELKIQGFRMGLE